MTMDELKKKKQNQAQNKDVPLPIQEDHVLEQRSTGLVSSSGCPAALFPLHQSQILTSTPRRIEKGQLYTPSSLLGNSITPVPLS